MSGFMDWKYVSEVQVSQLEKESTDSDLKIAINKIFQSSSTSMTKRKQSILCNFHFFNYAFCKENAFNSRKISTFLSIMHELLLKDSTINSAKKTIEARFDYFQDLLIKHSVQRSPQSVQIFMPNEVELILAFVTESYFRKFRLYQYIFDTLFVVTIKQVSPNLTESPKLPLSLAEGYAVKRLDEQDTAEETSDAMME